MFGLIVLSSIPSWELLWLIFLLFLDLCFFNFFINFSNVIWILFKIKVGLMNILNAKNSDVAYPNFLHCDIMDINSLNPCTICYQFDSLFVAKVQKYIAKLFNKSKSCQYLVSYNALKAVKNFGFKVTLVHKLPVSMMSSGEGKTCHIYQKLETAIRKSTLQDDDDIDPKIQQLLSTRSVGREEFLESINEEVNTWLTTKPDSRQTRGSRAKA